MKRCEKCNQLYADDFEKCPYCNNTVTKEIIKYIILFLIICVIFVILLFIMCSKNDNMPAKNKTKQNQAAWLLTINEYGDKYPYTIDNLIVRCEPDRLSNNNIAIWLEDETGNKYGLNGIAYNKFTRAKDKTYKGYTDLILKKDKTDIYTPAEAEQCCLKTGY